MRADIQKVDCLLPVEVNNFKDNPQVASRTARPIARKFALQFVRL